VRVLESENPSQNDVIFVAEESKDYSFEELFVKVRTKTDSSYFVKIPALTIEHRKKKIEEADKDLKKA
jgi:hypothetical protein